MLKSLPVEVNYAKQKTHLCPLVHVPSLQIAPENGAGMLCRRTPSLLPRST